jgi:DHA2 family multidrug resistance protein
MAASTTTMDQAAQAAWRPRVNPWAIAATVALAAFMEVLDTSIANVALPYIAGGLAASQDQSEWVLTTYLVANAVVLPMGGWAASVIGRKNFFMLCLCIFIVSSFLCGIATSLGLLLVFRVFQGAGGGGLQPMAQAIMADSFEPRKRGLAFALYGIVAVLAPSIGPTVGGWITDNYSWHWIFYINIPVGLLALFLVQRLVEDPPFLKHDWSNFKRVDYIGIILLALSMGSLEIFLDKGEERSWFGSHFVVGFMITFAVSFSFLMLITGGILNASTVLQPQFLQRQLGYTATIAGLSLSMGGLVLLVVMPMAGQAVSRFPARNIICFGFILFACGFFYSATHVSLGISFGFASWLRVIQIMAIPFVFISVTTAAYFGLPSEKNNQVAGLINFARNIGGSILISLSNAFVTESALFHQATLGQHLSSSSPNYQRVLSQYTAAFRGIGGPANAQIMAQTQIYNQLIAQTQALAYVDVYYVLGAASIIMIFLSFLLDKNDPKAGGAPAGAVH